MIEAPQTDVAGRDTAFEQEALPWLDDVHRFALSLTRDAADADDIVQETFLRAYKSWHTYLSGSDCRRWLFTICHNVFLRSRERQTQMVDIEDWEHDASLAASAFHEVARHDAFDLYGSIDLRAAVEDALARVPEPFRSAVLLVDVEDQSYETAAEILRVPIGTVRSRLFRGRRLMQEMLLAYARDAGFACATRDGVSD